MREYPLHPPLPHASTTQAHPTAHTRGIPLDALDLHRITGSASSVASVAPEAALVMLRWAVEAKGAEQSPSLGLKSFSSVSSCGCSDSSSTRCRSACQCTYHHDCVDLRRPGTRSVGPLAFGSMVHMI